MRYSDLVGGARRKVGVSQPPPFTRRPRNNNIAGSIQGIREEVLGSVYIYICSTAHRLAMSLHESRVLSFFIYNPELSKKEGTVS